MNYYTTFIRLVVAQGPPSLRAETAIAPPPGFFFFGGGGGVFNKSTSYLFVKSKHNFVC